MKQEFNHLLYQGHGQPKILSGSKCLILGEQQYFVSDTASKYKMIRYSKIFGRAMAPCPPWLRLCTCGLYNVYVMKILHVNTYVFYLYNYSGHIFYKRVY